MRGTVAEVRLLMQSHRVEEGGNAAHSSRTFDACDLHIPRMRDACLRGGHQVVDTTGDLAGLAAGCPDWNVFRSDSGRLYASTRLDGSLQGTTVQAWLVGQLHARIDKAAAARGVSAGAAAVSEAIALAAALADRFVTAVPAGQAVRVWIGGAGSGCTLITPAGHDSQPVWIWPDGTHTRCHPRGDVPGAAAALTRSVTARPP